MLGNIKNPFKFYSGNIEKWSQDILDHWEEIENYAFVFYLQPIDSNYYCTVIHLSPASNGKADESHLNKLDFLKEKMKNHHITILGNAFDADNKYDCLHTKYLSQYSKRVISKDGSIFEITQKVYFRIICDPLHMLKRARYRMLKNIPMAISIQANPTIFSHQIVEEYLKIPSIVFNDSPITKMHDILPLTLFSIDNLFTLYNSDLTALVYFTPWTMLIEAFTNEKINLGNRIAMLDVSFFIMFIYLQYLKHTQTNFGIYRKKCIKAHHITFFDEKICMHYCNTVHAIVSIIQKKEGKNISLNRLSSNPLEHLFGKIRLKSGFLKTLKVALRVLSTEQILESLCHSKMDELKVMRRTSSFGIKLSNNDLNSNILDYDARSIAYSILIIGGMNDIDPNIINGIQIGENNPEMIARSFYNNIFDFIYNCDRKIPKKNMLGISSLNLSVGTSFACKNLIKSKTEIGVACSQANNETSNMNDESAIINFLKKYFSPKLLCEDLQQIIINTSQLFQIPYTANDTRSKKNMIHWIAKHFNIIKEAIIRISVNMNEIQ